jgi:hypothetical protein
VKTSVLPKGFERFVAFVELSKGGFEAVVQKRYRSLILEAEQAGEYEAQQYYGELCCWR